MLGSIRTKIQNSQITAYLLQVSFGEYKGKIRSEERGLKKMKSEQVLQYHKELPCDTAILIFFFFAFDTLQRHYQSMSELSYL